MHLEIVHVAIAVAAALGLGEADAVDDRSMIEGVGNDGILGAEERLEHTAIGIETGGIKDAVLMLHIIGDPGLELAMEVARPANEPHRRHAEAMGLHGGLCRFDQGWMIGEPQIIVGAEIKHLVTDTIADDLDMSVLRRNDGALRLPKRLSADGFELGRNIGKHGHRVLLGQTMFHNGKRAS